MIHFTALDERNRCAGLADSTFCALSLPDRITSDNQLTDYLKALAEVSRTLFGVCAGRYALRLYIENTLSIVFSSISNILSTVGE